MRSILGPALALVLATSACIADENMTQAPETGSVWRLVSLDGAPYPARATLGFPEDGVVAGAAPCNAYSGALRVPLPGFGLGPVRATRSACGELEAERAFFAALGAMTQAEIRAGALVLTSPEGREMTFERLQP